MYKYFLFCLQVETKTKKQKIEKKKKIPNPVVESSPIEMCMGVFCGQGRMGNSRYQSRQDPEGM